MKNGTLLICILSLVFFALRGLAETTSSEGKGPLQITITGGNYDPGEAAKFAFYPRVAKFSDNRNKARCYADPMWNSFSYVDQAGYVQDVFMALLKLHQGQSSDPDAYRFSHRILTCKAFKESSFDTQMGNEYGSSALGMSQVLEGTGKDLFERKGFRSRIPGYEHISTYADFKKAMAAEPSLQLELGMAVMEMKRQDYGLDVDNVKPFLKKYYGSGSDTANDVYAESIYLCASCVKSNGEMYSQKCLCQAKPDDMYCLKITTAPQPKNCE